MKQLKPLPYMNDSYSPHFTVDQAREVIRIVFPTRTKNINTNHSSYGIKHLFERLTSYIGGEGRHKYCSNQTIKEAMRLEGFQVYEQQGTPNHFYNISEADYKAVDLMGALQTEFYYSQVTVSHT
jgi:hypothetical protein